MNYWEIYIHKIGKKISYKLQYYKQASGQIWKCDIWNDKECIKFGDNKGELLEYITKNNIVVDCVRHYNSNVKTW